MDEERPSCAMLYNTVGGELENCLREVKDA